jgi:hypothetical protein
MKLRLSILLLAAAALAAAPAAGQTIKSLGYNTTNGNIVAATNVTFTNSVGFATNARATTRTNLGLGGSDNVSFNSLQLAGSGGLSIGGMDLEATNSGLDLAINRTGTTQVELKTNGLVLHVGSYSFSGGNSNGASTTRTNLSLGATWLTNTSAANFRTAIGLGETNAVTFSNITASGTLTATGNVTMSGVGNTAPSQTASSGSSLMTRDLGDARYGLPRLLKMETNISSVTSSAASETYSTESVTLEAGTYEVTAQILALIDSATAGMTVAVDGDSSNNGTGVAIGNLALSSSYDDGAYNGTFVAPQYGAVIRNGSENFIFLITDSAARRTMYYGGRGFLTLTATRTFKFSILQRHATDASNPAVLQADRSFVIFKKIN